MTIMLTLLCCLSIGAVMAKYKVEINLKSFNLSIKQNTQYILNLDLNSSGAVGGQEAIESGSSTFKLPSEPPEHNWGRFLGWSTDENATHFGWPDTAPDTSDLLQPGESFTGEGGEAVDNVISYTLYAVWYLESVVQNNFEEAVAAADGGEVIIGGGVWELPKGYDDWFEFNPDPSKRLKLTIWDGEFNGWVLKITNTDVVIKGGVFNALNSFFMDGGTTITINGGDWTNITKFTFTEVPNAKVTGGTFGFNPSSYVPEGYTVVNNGNGTWTVRAGSAG